MILKLIIHTYLLLLVGSVKARGQAAAYKFAKPGCQEKCGDVTIPFPFGIGPEECFLGLWYEIICENGTNTPILKKPDLQVQYIQLPYNADAILKVHFPVVYSSSCSRNKTSKAVVLEGSSFMTAPDRKIFIAAGCNNVALIENTKSEVAGCKLSECNKPPGSQQMRTNPGSFCAGYGCCETTIPSGLQSFNVSFNTYRDDNASGSVKGCSYAALVEQQESLFGISSWKMEEYVPTVLLWGVPNEAHLGIDLHGVNTKLSVYICTYNSLSHPFSVTMPFTQCYCRMGYAGNPYLMDGCLDINECDNPYICPGLRCVNRDGGYHCVDHKRTVKLVMTGIGMALGALLSLALFFCLHKIIKRRREENQKEKLFKRNGGLILQQQLSSSPKTDGGNGKLFGSKELEKATDNFNEDRIVGRGGQGTVFKGMLTDGRIVAIKKSIEIAEDFVEQFINEFVILSQINHRNVVKLLGCCLETEVPLLVYEFIPNGTLYEYLHEPTEEFWVTWDVRLRIACEVAGALSYLHSAASVPIYHRDIKTSNILLDEMYRAKVADFGTSRSVCSDHTHITTLVKGTFGYLNPEYFQSSRFTDKSDVYSFGVVLVELLTGQKAVSSSREDEGRSLVMYFIISMEQNCLLEIVDAQLPKDANNEEVMAVASLAKRCLHLHGRNRPTMKEVSMELEGIRNPQQSQHVNRTDDWSDYYFRDEAISEDSISFSS